MTDTNELIRPLPLRIFLENGGDPRVVLGTHIDGFLEYCQEAQAGILGPDGASRRAEHCRHEVECALQGVSPGEWATGRPMDVTTDQTRVTAEAWEADLIEAPELAETVAAWLDPVARAEYDAMVYKVKHPHPLELVRGKGTVCAGCSAPLGDRVAMAIGEQEGYSDSQDHFDEWCFECVAKVYEAMKAAQ